jgi:hypothetical protein
MLKRMQAEIEALNQRWILTEEKLRSGQNLYHLISRSTKGSTGNFRSTTPPPPKAGGNLLATTASSPLYQVNNFSTGFMREHSPHLLTNNHLQSHNILLTTLNPSIHRLTPIDQQPPSLLNIPFPPSTTNLLDTSSKHHHHLSLLTLNDRLTRQIEDNLTLFDNLNHELSSKEAALQNGDRILSEKDREVSRLRTQIKTMDENMRHLLLVTKSTTEATEISRGRHREEMDKIRRR